MTTNSIPARSTDRPERVSLWIPRSRAAVGLLILGVVAATWPAVLAAAWVYSTYTGCFWECQEPNRGGAAVLAALAIVMVLWPFVAIRIYQALRPVSARVWLGVVLVVDLALLGWAINWHWPGPW